MAEIDALPSWWPLASARLSSVTTTKQSIQRGAARFDVAAAASKLLVDGHMIVDGFLGKQAALEVQGTIRDLDSIGALRTGKIQHGVNQSTRVTSRSDRIAFIPSAQASASTALRQGGEYVNQEAFNNILQGSDVLNTFIVAMDQIRSRLSAHEMLTRRLGGSLDDCNFMCAVYPGGGARYVKHRDALPYKAGRKLTLIYYLNTNWRPGHGGELHIWPNDHESTMPVLVEPVADRLVIFVSSLEHEVLPAWHPRYALTTWMFNKRDTAMEVLAEDMRQRRASGKLNMQKLLAALDADSSEEDEAADTENEHHCETNGPEKVLDRSTALSVVMQLLRRKREAGSTQFAEPAGF